MNTIAPNSAIQAALDRAKTLSAQAPAQVPVTIDQPAAGGPVSAYSPVASFQPPSLGTFLSGPTRPDSWLKVNGGLMLGNSPTLFQEMYLILEAANNGMTPAMTLRYGDQSNVGYAKSYDGRTIAGTGADFGAEVEKKKREYMGKAEVYESVDLSFRTFENIVDPKNPKNTLLEAGKVIGYGTPKSGNDYVKRLAQEVQQVLGVSILTPGLSILVKLSPKMNISGNNKWWNIVFELAGVFDDAGNLSAVGSGAYQPKAAA